MIVAIRCYLVETNSNYLSHYNRFTSSIHDFISVTKLIIWFLPIYQKIGARISKSELSRGNLKIFNNGKK